jgi:hypothetical protein
MKTTVDGNIERTSFSVADESSLIEQLHTLAMDKDPMKAATGRLMKQMFPVIMRWADGERERTGHVEPHQLYAIGSAMASATAFAAECISQGRTDKFLITILAKQIDQHLKLSAEHYGYNKRNTVTLQ